MSISDALGLSIFCRKMENVRPTRKEMDGKVVSEEIEGRVTKKLSQEFSKRENRILGALSPVDDFLMNPLIQGHSGTAPETSRNNLAQTREQMGTTPRVIFILKQASFVARQHKTLAQKLATTGP